MGVPVIDSNDVVRDYKGNKADLFAPTGAHWSALGGAELLAKFIDERAHESHGQAELTRPAHQVMCTLSADLTWGP